MRSRWTVFVCSHSREIERLVINRCSMPAEALKLCGLWKSGSKKDASGLSPEMPAAVKNEALAAEEESGTKGKTNSGCTVRACLICVELSVNETPTFGLPLALKAWLKRSIGVRA